MNYCEREFSIAGKDQAGANPFDLIDAYHAIHEPKSKVDRIIVIYHGGIEYQHYPTPEMVKYFRFMVDIGVDSIVAHHTHAYSGYERYKGNMIYYGLGNLVSSTSARQPDGSWFVGITAKLDIKDKSNEYGLFTFKQAADFSQVAVASKELKKRVEEKICEINKAICDSKLLTSYWDNVYAAYRQSLYRHLLIPNQSLKKLVKKTGLHLNISRKYRIELLNMFRCDAHRYRAINLLSIEK